MKYQSFILCGRVKKLYYGYTYKNVINPKIVTIICNTMSDTIYVAIDVEMSGRQAQSMFEIGICA